MLQSAQARTIKVTPVSGLVGAEISGIDLSKSHDDLVYKEIRQAVSEHGVIFFRDQTLDPKQFLHFASHFGTPDRERFMKPVEGYPEVSELIKEPKQRDNIGDVWHTDRSCYETPAFATILYAREVPLYGGDTHFASMTTAYDGLSDGLKATLKNLKAWHSNSHVYGPTAKEKKNNGIVFSEHAVMDAMHPVVIRIPETGREALYVNPLYTYKIDGWSESESKALLNFLSLHGQKPEYICRVRHQVGTVSFWDNRQVWHYAANDYHGYRRVMNRICTSDGPLHAAA